MGGLGKKWTKVRQMGKFRHLEILLFLKFNITIQWQFEIKTEYLSGS